MIQSTKLDSQLQGDLETPCQERCKQAPSHGGSYSDPPKVLHREGKSHADILSVGVRGALAMVGGHTVAQGLEGCRRTLAGNQRGCICPQCCHDADHEHIRHRHASALPQPAAICSRPKCLPGRQGCMHLLIPSKGKAGSRRSRPSRWGRWSRRRWCIHRCEGREAADPCRQAPTNRVVSHISAPVAAGEPTRFDPEIQRRAWLILTSTTPIGCAAEPGLLAKAQSVRKGHKGVFSKACLRAASLLGSLARGPFAKGPSTVASRHVQRVETPEPTEL